MDLIHCAKYVLIIVLITATTAQEDPTFAGLKVLKRVYNHCEQSTNLLKCLKVQALKFTDRALNSDNINLVDGVEFVREQNAEARSMNDNLTPITETVNLLPSSQIDSLLIERAQRFFDTHKIQFSVPKLMQDDADNVVEGRGKNKDLKKYIGPLIAAITLKGGLLAMTFKAVALLAGKALLVGKIALVLSTILGLKKLLSNESHHEKTTYEIVKHPHVSHAQTYSSSHLGGGGGEYESGPYHRSYETNTDYSSQDKAYRAYTTKQYQ